MKRRYERPSAYIEEFTPNEYVAACGDSGKVYNFKCNAGVANMVVFIRKQMVSLAYRYQEEIVIRE